MIVDYHNGHVSEGFKRKILEHIFFMQERIEEREKLIKKTPSKFPSSFNMFAGDYENLCACSLQIFEFERILDYRKRIVEIFLSGQKKFGFTYVMSRRMVMNSILSRDETYTINLCRSLLKKKIEAVPGKLEHYEKFSFLSLLNLILDHERTIDILKKHTNYERRSITRGDLTGIGKIGLSIIQRNIFKKEKEKFLENINVHLAYRLKNYKTEGSLLYSILPSYLFFLAKDKDINLDIEYDVPKKYHIIIPDVLHFD